MTEIRSLENAPITEAIIDIRVKSIEDFPEQIVANIKERLRGRYPKVDRRKLVQGKFKVGPGTQLSQTTEELGLHGFIFKSEDELKVAQFRNDGFTFSRLKPYTNWEEVSEEAHDLWGIYCDLVSPRRVTRIAVRYINRLKIPLPVSDLSQYLKAPPSAPGDLSLILNNFITRVVLVDPKLGIAINLTQVLESIVDTEYLPIILDIDVYKKEQYKPADPSIWDVFETLREVKNQIFFSSLTEKAIRLFE